MRTRDKHTKSLLFHYSRWSAYALGFWAILVALPADAGPRGDGVGRAPWTLTGSLAHERNSFQANTLLDGRVLVEGGADGGLTLNSSEIFDPISKTWSTSGNLHKARFLHSATLLADGRVLVAGGDGDNHKAINSAELYDPVSGTWSNTGDMIDAREGHLATVLPDGRVLVVGGVGNRGNLKSAEIYDPAAGTWTLTSDVMKTVQEATLTLLLDGRCLSREASNSQDRPVPQRHFTILRTAPGSRPAAYKSADILPLPLYSRMGRS